MVISRCYANKTISLPYTGTANIAVKTLVDQGVTTITTLTNNTLTLVQTLNNPFATQAALAALAAAELERQQTVNLELDYRRSVSTLNKWEFFYWQSCINANYNNYISARNHVTYWYKLNYSTLITNFESRESQMTSLFEYFKNNSYRVKNLLVNSTLTNG